MHLYQCKQNVIINNQLTKVSLLAADSGMRSTLLPQRKFCITHTVNHSPFRNRGLMESNHTEQFKNKVFVLIPYFSQYSVSHVCSWYARMYEKIQ